MLIDNAAETMEFNSIEQMDQGATTLYSITRYATLLLGTGQWFNVGQRGRVDENNYERGPNMVLISDAHRKRCEREKFFIENKIKFAATVDLNECQKSSNCSFALHTRIDF